MKNFWMSLQLREQVTLLIGGICLVVTLIYLQVVEPLKISDTALQQRIESQRQELTWMLGTAEEIKRLSKSDKVSAKVGTHQPLISLVDQSVRAAGLSQALKRVDPDGDRVRIQFEGVNFDAFLRWLGKMEGGHRLQIETLVVDLQEESGLVNSRLTLSREGLSE